jgi:hypothetical protein
VSPLGGRKRSGPLNRGQHPTAVPSGVLSSRDGAPAAARLQHARLTRRPRSPPALRARRRAGPQNVNVYVGNIPPEWAEADISAHFAGAGRRGRGLGHARAPAGWGPPARAAGRAVGPTPPPSCPAALPPRPQKVSAPSTSSSSTKRGATGLFATATTPTRCRPLPRPTRGCSTAGCAPARAALGGGRRKAGGRSGGRGWWRPPARRFCCSVRPQQTAAPPSPTLDAPPPNLHSLLAAHQVLLGQKRERPPPARPGPRRPLHGRAARARRRRRRRPAGRRGGRGGRGGAAGAGAGGRRRCGRGVRRDDAPWRRRLRRRRGRLGARHVPAAWRRRRAPARRAAARGARAGGGRRRRRARGRARRRGRRGNGRRRRRRAAARARRIPLCRRGRPGGRGP